MSTFPDESTWKSLANQWLPRGSLRRTLAGGAFWSVAAAMSSGGLALIAGILFAQILGKMGFGRWGLVLATASAFSQFASFGVASTATKHVAELRNNDTARAGRTLALLLLVALASVSLAALVCTVLGGRLATRLYGDEELVLPLTLAGLMVFGMVGSLMLQGALAGFEAFAFIAKVNLAQGLLLLGVAVPLTQWLGVVGTVVGMSVAHWAAMLLCMLGIISRTRRHHMPLDFSSAWMERRILWHYAIPSLLTACVTAPAHILSQAMVAHHVSGIAAIGGYYAAVRWRDMVLFIPTAVRCVTLPMLANLKGNNEPARFLKALWANIALSGGIALAGAVPVCLLSTWIIGLYGPDFRADWDLIVILAGSAVVQAANDVVTQVTTCLERVWWQFAIHVVYGAMLLGGSYSLVPTWGVRGLVVSLAATTVVHMILNTCAAIYAIRHGLYSSTSSAPDAACPMEGVA